MPQQDIWEDVEEPKDVWEDVSSLNPPKSIKPETKQFARSVDSGQGMIGDSIFGQSDKPKEPDTYWGGFRKSISDQLGEAFSAKNPMLQSAARPESLSDFANLVLPSGVPNLRRLLPKGILSKKGLPKVGKSIVDSKDVDVNFSTKAEADLAKPAVIPEETGLVRIEPEIPHQSVADDIVERGGVTYKKTGTNPDTGQPTYEPIHEAVGDPDIYEMSADEIPPEIADELDKRGPQHKSVAEETTEKSFTKLSPGVSISKAKPSQLGKDFEQSVLESESIPSQEPLNWKTDKQKVVNSAAAKAKRIKAEVEAKVGKPIDSMTPDEIKTSIPQDDIPTLLKDNSDEIKLMHSGLEPEIPEGLYRKVSNFNRSLLTAMDFSAPGRQGKGLITHKGYWTSFDDMFKAWGSKKGYENVQQSILTDPSGYFSPGVKGKSFADEAGLNLTDVVKNREEIFRSNLADKIPGVERSQRAYTAFLNKARADVFKELVNSAKKMGRDPETDLVLAKQLADSINVSTGRGSFGKLEQSATAMKALNEVFFAPKLMASRVQMYSRVLNPKLYTEADPLIRKEALRSLFGIVGTAGVIGELARLGGAQVSNDPTNSDFRKIKIGDKTRIDNLAGLQQYGVATARFLSGKSTSSVSGKTSDLTRPKFGGQTRADVLTNFATNKLAPIPSFIWAWMNTREFDGEPFKVKEALVNRTVPIVMQDIYELYQEDPSLIPLGILPIMGEGMQTYGR